MILCGQVPRDRSRRSKSQREETNNGKMVVGGFRQRVEVGSDLPRHASVGQRAGTHDVVNATGGAKDMR
eukprot:11084660-Prorocentrum_lima.AAC.1